LAMWQKPRSTVHNERTVHIIMAGYIAHARNNHISTSALKSDVTMAFVSRPRFPLNAKISAIRR